MAEQDSPQQGDRTEPATPRRLQRAREEGNVAVSRELAILAGLVMTTATIMIAGPGLLHVLVARLRGIMSHAADPALTDVAVVHHAAMIAAQAGLPITLAALAGGALAVLTQTGFLFHGEALAPKLSRINPGSGLRRLIGPDNVIEVIKALGKLTLVGLALWWATAHDIAKLSVLPLMEPRMSMTLIAPAVLRAVLAVILAQTAITGFDLLWVRIRHARQLRMSRQDIREEQRETEGDPTIRARIRQIRQQRARRRMLQAVRSATVVVTNPTHYAVALTYDRARHAAPRIVAKGVDFQAARIRDVAQECRIPLVSNPPLARALYQVELDTEIPAEHYQAVAEVIAYVWRLRDQVRAPL